jgi:hypothetical protein
MKKKNKRSALPPPPPANASEYILVKSKEGPHWRKIRGSNKEATLNTAWQQSADSTVIFSHAARRIKNKLSDFLRGLETGRFLARVGGRLKKAYTASGKISFSLLEDYELQPYRTLSELLCGGYRVDEENQRLIVTAPVDATAVKQLSSLVTAFYIEIILLYGDPLIDNSLKLESEISPLYNFKQKVGAKCTLAIDIPKKTPWMLLLKVSCHEGDSLALHCRHYGMKVIKTG